jgi:hypothetical protein
MKYVYTYVPVQSVPLTYMLTKDFCSPIHFQCFCYCFLTTNVCDSDVFSSDGIKRSKLIGSLETKCFHLKVKMKKFSLCLIN